MMMFLSQRIQSEANTIKSRVQLYPPPILIALVQEFPKEDFITAELSQHHQLHQWYRQDGMHLGDLEEQWRHQHQVQALTVQIVLWYYHPQLHRQAVTVQMRITTPLLHQFLAMTRYLHDKSKKCFEM